jgi:hypothetical protein
MTQASRPHPAIGELTLDDLEQVVGFGSTIFVVPWHRLAETSHDHRPRRWSRSQIKAAVQRPASAA